MGSPFQLVGLPSLLTSTLDISLIPLDVSSTYFLFSGLVTRSTKFNSEPYKFQEYNPYLQQLSYSIVSQAYIHVLSIKYVALSLSYCNLAIISIDIDGVALIYKGIFAKRFLSYSTLEFAFSKAIISTFIVDRVMQIFLANFQEIAPPPSMKTYHQWISPHLNQRSNQHH